MNESKEKWETWFLIVCTIITVIACLLAIWITCQNAKYVEEIKDLKSEVGQAYFIEEGTVISASEEDRFCLSNSTAAISFRQKYC